MKDLQEYLERWFKERRVRKHMVEVLAVREKIARLTIMIAERQRTMNIYNIDRSETINMLGNLEVLKVRLAHLDAISRNFTQFHAKLKHPYDFQTS